MPQSSQGFISFGDIQSGRSTPAPPPATSEQPGQGFISFAELEPAITPTRSMAQQAGEILKGAAKGAAGTAYGVGKFIREPLGGANPLGTILTAIGEMIQPGAFQGTAEEAFPELQPQGLGQQIGKGAERVAEMMVPLGISGKAAALLKHAPKLVRSGVRMATEAAEMGAKAAVQSGTPEDIGEAAAFGAGGVPVGAAISTAGKILFRSLPKALYTQIFKISRDDLTAAYKAAAVGKINPTTAQEMLERGVFGSSENMAVYSYKKLDVLEGQLQASLQGKSLKLPNKQAYLELLDTLKSEFGGVFSEMGTRAGQLAGKIRAGVRGPYVSAKDALDLKRLLDSARNVSSFRASTVLSPKQDEYKQAADLVRRTLHTTFSDASKLLDEERIFITATDAIVDDAVQRQNRRLLGLTDYILGGGGMASGYGVQGVGAAAMIRGFQRPATLTGLGQLLYRMGQHAPTAESLARSAAAAGTVAARENK